MILVALLILAQSGPDAPGPESCGDLDSLAAGATAGTVCGRIDAVQSCLERLAATPEDLPHQWLLWDGTVVTHDDASIDAGAEPTDAGSRPFLELDAEDCTTYADKPPTGGIWRDKLLAECLHVVAAAGVRAELRRSIEVQLARAERLGQTCATAAQRTTEQATRAQELADQAAQAALEKAHPEAPVLAISAVLCRVDAYQKWVKGQLNVANRIGGADNQIAAHQLRLLKRFLDAKTTEAKRVLTERYHAKSAACGKEPVRSLWHCVAPPTLLDDHGEAYVQDPAETCETPPERYDWYRPRTGWYLGADWFQPAHSAGQ